MNKMDKTKTKGVVSTKRSLDSSLGDAESESVCKKPKPKLPEDEPVQLSEPNKMGQQSKTNNRKNESEIDPSETRSGTSSNIMKRSGDFLSKNSQYLSPSKKRKTVAIQDELEHIEDNEYPYRDDMDKKRKRVKRTLLKAVLEQMEFYFSDGNLHKDRFMRKLYDDSDSGYVDLSIFSNFNKLQSLNKDGVDADIICEALSKSKLLEVAEGRTKIRRRTPLLELNQEEVDKRTVYVEYLPDHATHVWIQKIFSQCGKVLYVSLPRYRTSKEIKGFAFVEFRSVEEADKACEMLNNPPPKEKAGKFPKWNKTLKSLQKSGLPLKTDEPDIYEENMQVEPKEEPPQTPPKKKKNNKTKKKADESGDKPSAPEQGEEKGEEKKKKKKKKRKASISAESGPTNDKDFREGSKVEEDKSEASQSSSLKVSEKERTEEKNLVENRTENSVLKKKKKKKRKKKVEGSEERDSNAIDITEKVVGKVSESEDKAMDQGETVTDETNKEAKLTRKERKFLRQEDIRRKKAERELLQVKVETEGKEFPDSKTTVESETEEKEPRKKRVRLDSLVSESSETESPSKVYVKSDGSQVTSILGKSRKQDVVKKVEFDPVPITTEFVERKEVRRRKKQKRDSLHLRVLSKKDWLLLREEFIHHQKSRMTVLKDQLRELRMQENEEQTAQDSNGKKHVDLTSVFGTNRMKPSKDVKIAHVEELKFIPNVIVQWTCSHEIDRNKIKTMFSEISSDSIAYIEGKEVATSGYIRFKDEASAEEFARLSRTTETDSFSARVLPESQQASYWEKANRDRINKLSRKKKERGTDKIARKVFERNKATFQAKGSHVVFNNDDEDNNDEKTDADVVVEKEMETGKMEDLSQDGDVKS